MNIATLLKAIVSLVDSVLQYFREEKLRQQGRNEVIIEAQNELESKRAIADDAIANVNRVPVSEDKNNRARKRKNSSV